MPQEKRNFVVTVNYICSSCKEAQASVLRLGGESTAEHVSEVALFVPLHCSGCSVALPSTGRWVTEVKEIKPPV